MRVITNGCLRFPMSNWVFRDRRHPVEVEHSGRFNTWQWGISMNEESLLQRALGEAEELDFAVLIGSRARGEAREDSDWDLAIQWAREPTNILDVFSRDESLRHRLATALDVADDRIDVVNLGRAGLAMRAAVAEEGGAVVGHDRLPWMHFLSRTWRELEYWEWERTHAA